MCFVPLAVGFPAGIADGHKNSPFKEWYCYQCTNCTANSVFCQAVSNARSAESRRRRRQTNAFPIAIWLNIKGAGVEAINTAIVDKANDFLNGRNTISYDFHINGKILSIAIKYVDYYDEVVKYPVITFDVYNINFYESKILSSNDMLSIYGVNEADVKEIVEGKFVDFYNDELEKGYFHDECDYACFLYQRGITDDNYMEDIYYYVKDGNLYVLKPFKVYSP